MTTLKSEQITLRNWLPADEDSLVRYANNPKIAANLRDRFPQPYTREDAKAWIQIANESQPLQNFAIEVDSHAVGGIGLILGEDIYKRSAEMGYWLAEPYWGKGIATDAVKLTTEYAFKTFSLVRIYAGVFETNPASARVLEKAGYQLEGRQQKSVFKNGRILDQMFYVNLR